ncbi:hypothetical protein [Rhizobium sp. RAF56]|uniref:hypothetical protein n=1 Tax=Rhizobium sp. RAF56 TaxID=3233062 RepID=UPI003F96A43D
MTTETGPYLICSIDPGGTTDPAAIVVGKVHRANHMTSVKILHLDALKPTVTPMAHVTFAQSAMAKVYGEVGHGTTRFICDVSNNSAIAYLLAQALPRDTLVGCKIINADSHSAGLTPMLIGDIGGRAASIPIMNLSRKQLLLDVGVAFQSGILSLPLTDPAQQTQMQELKRQMSRASMKVTPAGRQIAVIDRGHDDILMSLAQLLAATKLPAPRGARRSGERREPLSSTAWT